LAGDGIVGAEPGAIDSEIEPEGPVSAEEDDAVGDELDRLNDFLGSLDLDVINTSVV
jgi:hypothetical protein